MIKLAKFLILILPMSAKAPSFNIIYSQLNDYTENKFSKYLPGFRKNHITQNSLLRMTESWKAKLNNGSKIGVIIMNLSKAFYSLNHDL